ncbi:MAG: hypothetical protein RBU29_12535 [bacterium]|jgi:flagellar motor switch/type III secretory pathway protein FliN|nr:hypothetical protein [bacterium]
MKLASSLKLIDILSLKPGSFLYLHAVRGEVGCDQAQAIARTFNWRHQISHVIFPTGDTQKRHNLSKLLDISIDTQVIIKYPDDKVLEIFHLDEYAWNAIDAHLGRNVDILVDGRIFAHGVITAQQGQNGILIQKLANA